MRYRPEIDGLRALCILAVVGCHVNIPVLAGGFVGVDAFFVISGFLITTLLRIEQDTKGRINLSAFYARRLRRLIPALALVLTVTLIAAVFLLSVDGEQQDFAGSAFSVSTFTSNIYFGLSRTGYFLSNAQFAPLLHTWSLGVEEQFYMFWPLAMIALTGLSRRLGAKIKTPITPIAVGAGTALSLLICVALSDRVESFAFYAFPARAWELGAGALLAFWLPGRPSRPVLGQVMAIAGCGLLAAVACLYTPTPSFNPMAPFLAVLSAALIISGTALAPNGLATRMLAAAPMVLIGKVSYAWYLWHWVILAFGRIHNLGAESLVRDLVLAAVSFVLAAATWKFVEQPVRQKRVRGFVTDKGALTSTLALLAFCAALAGALWASAQYRLQRDPLALAAAQAKDQRIRLLSCEQDGIVKPDFSKGCVTGARGADDMVLVIGDSHARHLMPGMELAAKRSGIALAWGVKSNCRPSLAPSGPALFDERAARCREFLNATIAALPALKRNGLSAVIIAARWEMDSDWNAALPSYVEQIRAQNLRVVLVSDTPNYPYSVPRCIVHAGVERCEGDRQSLEEDRASDVAALNLIGSGSSEVLVWDAMRPMCSANRCKVFDHQFLYSDANHLSIAGSQRLAPELGPVLQWAVGRPAADLGR